MQKPLEQIRGLLRDGEKELPEAVQRTAAFLDRHGLWCVVSRNHEARSCRDAAHKRMRMGNTGIPLHDELKSFLGKFIDPENREAFVMAHCRGHQNIQLGKLRAHLQSKSAIERLSNEHELQRFGMEYGTVNPFTAPPEIESRIVHVFDSSLQSRWGIPGTMMTNAGEPTWAVEFDSSALVRAFGEGAIVADIVEESSRGYNPRATTVGIITGNSPDAGMSLWRQLNTRIREQSGRAFRGDLSLPRVLVYSLPEMGLSMELEAREEPVWEAIREAVLGLCEQGIEILAIACNTTQYFAPRIREITEPRGIRFVTIADAVLGWLEHNEVEELALVAIPIVAELGKWSEYRDLAQHVKVEHLPHEALTAIEELGYRVKKEGVSEAGLQGLRNIIQRHVVAKHVLIALTELSNLLEAQRRQGKSGKVIIDTLALYADRLANLCLARLQPLEGESIQPAL